MELSKVLEPIVDDMAAVERRLGAVAERIASSDDARTGQSAILDHISQHLFAVPGKRLRPALVLLSSLSGRGGESRAAAVGLATAVEVLHAASLVHDDIIDGAEERRHQISLNKRYGNRVAVLAGDILYTEFFSLITGLPVAPALCSRLLSLFLGTTRKMCIGEILAQESEAAGGALGFEDYLVISEDKTAALFASCCEGGALVGGSADDEAFALGRFGLNFGLTFQMLDDIADQDYRLDPEVDLRSKMEEYARRTKDAVNSFGPSSAAGISELLEYVLAQALFP
jgi:octaprenyl-diphosphate synthase